MADTFKVEHQIPTTDIGAAGFVVPAVKIDFTTRPNNIPGTVIVPAASYERAEVEKILSKAAAELEAVQNL